ncbi:AsmA family protein [Rhizorhabdus phycosphaerae]|uniref:AsmA family protein n=1 Tax=Rhizorhabdus phycosphaerae TaxID=2711156 RepID=UPI0013ED33AB|nr:AsmA family protein [Rhizorhabdus phycosphaerae]
MTPAVRTALIGTAALSAFTAIGLAAFPWSMLRGEAERRLSDHYGRSVRIASLERLDAFSLSPRLRIRDLTIPQADWAGPGSTVAIRQADFGVSLPALLTGRARLRDVRVDGMRLDFVRSADGRESWKGVKAKASSASGSGPMIDGLSIADGRLIYRDAKRDRTLNAALTVDSGGLKLDGSGTVLGAPVRMTASGPTVTGTSPWPFQADIAGAALTMRAKGRMDRPLDIRHMALTVSARAANLSYVDAIIEAGLPRTQPVRLAAQARRDGTDWAVTALNGNIGRSHIAGGATIRKRDGRSIIEGDVYSRQFDFDDLSDARGRAIAAAKRAKAGPRVFPDTAIDLHNVARTDGRLTLKADKLLWPGPSPFRSLSGTLDLQHSLLRIDDLKLGLSHGTMAGSFRVDQRSGRPVMTMALHLNNGRLTDFAPNTQVDGRLDGRLRLTGTGRTIRAAIARSNGQIGIVARNGALPARTAALLGQDLLKGLTLDKAKQASLRCAIVRLEVRGGMATANPILIDTTRARTDISGSVNLNGEHMMLTMRGTGKQDSALKLHGPITIGGTLKQPQIALPKGGPVGTILKSIGRAMDGKKEPVAGDAACGALTKRAMAVG